MEKNKLKFKLPELENGLLTSPLSFLFEKKIPKIGTNRKLHKTSIHPQQNFISREKNFSSLPINTISLSDAEEKSILNLNLYKNQNQKLKLVYTDNEFEQDNINKDIVDYQFLTKTIYFDNTFDNFINPHNGQWVDYDYSLNTNNQIKFDSNFEEGNLRLAIQINDNEYDLVMRKDFNNISNYSWFFFEVISPVQKEIKFNIINFPRKRLLFTDNCRVLVYNDNDKWTRNTYNVYSFTNGIPLPSNLVDETNVPTKDDFEVNINEKDDQDKDKDKDKDKGFNLISFSEPKVDTTISPTQFYTTLTFTYNIRKDLVNKPIYFAYCFPYTYTNLQNYLHSLSLNPSYKSLIKFSTLGNTLCGNPLDVIYITNWNDPQVEQKKVLFFTGRVHPGESNSSYVVEGLINALLSPVSDELRKNFLIKIVPMLNPDGVINGNYRNNINGKDLNRLWVDPKPYTYPTIANTKSLMKLNHPEFYCDFHGHSCISNICMYGCCQINKNPNILFNKSYRTEEEKVFMKIYEKEIKYYNKESSKYNITRYKRKTARAVVYYDICVSKSYCLETSTASFMDEHGDYPITLDILRNVGKDFVECLGKLMNKSIFLSYWVKIRAEDDKKKKKKKKGKKKTKEDCFAESRVKKFFKLENEGVNVNVRKRAESEGKNIMKFKSFFRDK